MIYIKIYLLSNFKKIIKNSQNYLHIISHKMSDYYLLVLSENIITLENRQIMKPPLILILIAKYTLLFELILILTKNSLKG